MRLTAILSLLFTLLVGETAHAQLPQTLPANTVVGRLGIGTGPGQAIPFSTLLANLGGIDSNLLGNSGAPVLADYTINPGDCSKTLLLGTGTTGFFRLTVPSAAGFLSTCSIVVMNGDTGRGKGITGLTNQSMLWPLQGMIIKVINGGWAVVVKPPKWAPTGAVTFCIDATNGNDTTDGLTSYSSGACTTPSQAFKTIQRCIDVVSGEAFWNAVQPTCQVANHTGIIEAPFMRPYEANDIYQVNQPTIQGDCTTPANVVIKGASTGAVFTTAAQAQAWTVRGFTIAPTSATDYAFFVDWFGTLNIGATRITSAANVGIFSRYGSAVEILAATGCKNWEIAANLNAFAEAAQNSVVLAQGSTANIPFTLTGTPAWANAFAIALDGGYVDLQALNPSGASTGSRYSAARGIVLPAGTTLPGNAAGIHFDCYDGSTSGKACIGAPAVAGGSGLLLLPANLNDTLLARTSTDTVINKTMTTTSNNFVGTATNDSAVAGNVGEYVESIVVTGSAVALTTATAANLTSISLTAGDWDVWCDFNFNLGATTSITQLEGSISTASATLDQAAGRFANYQVPAQVPGGNLVTVHAGPRRVSIASTTTVYGVAFATFTVSTNAVWGNLRARRVR